MDLVKRARLALCMLVLLVAGFGVITSCVDDYKENPCDTGNGLVATECGNGICHTFIDVRETCTLGKGIPASCADFERKPGQADTCGDGLDNDCDGTVDENDSGDCTCTDLDDKGGENTKSCYTGSPDTRNKGICHDGKQTCEENAWQQCKDFALPAHEICDGLDNNCNGEVDEECECAKDGDQQACYDGPEGTIGKGVCVQGKQTCSKGKWSKCIGDVAPKLEGCSTEDLDCDGITGNGSTCICTEGETKPCYTPSLQNPGDKTEGTGLCHGGFYPCVNGIFDTSVCIGEVTPLPEICNTKDDDCDGIPDNGGNGSGMPCLPDGSTCALSSDCANNHCVDGFCCQEACSGLCKACSVSKKGGGQNGICGNIPLGQDPDQECIKQDQSTCGNSGTGCDGMGDCAKYSAGVPVPDQVIGDCHEKQCDGDGHVDDVVKDSDKPNDGNSCTADVCANGQPQSTPKNEGDTCSENNGSVCNNSGKCVECISPNNCLGKDTECQLRACKAGGVCGFVFTPSGTPLSTQIPGDCHVSQCDGSGGIVDAIKDSDINDDNNACTFDVCINGVASHPFTDSGSACNKNGNKFCDGSGQCVQCVVPATCPGQDNECQTRTCTAGVCGTSFISAGTPTSTQTPGDCHENQCNGAGVVVNAVKDSDINDDNNACTFDACTNGVASHAPTGSGSTCSQSGGSVCNGNGQCVQCVLPTSCPGQDNECQTRTCTSGVCGIGFTLAGTPTATQTLGDCHESQCNGAGGIVITIKDSDVGDDNNACTFDACTNGVASHVPTGSGSTCSQSGGSVCNGSGQCVQCVAPANCPGQDTECQTRTCIASTCGFSFVALNTPTTTQTLGDCQEKQCNGVGGIVNVNKDSDVKIDGKECTSDICVSGSISNPPLPASTPCNQAGGNKCNGSGDCVECLANAECASKVCAANNTCSVPSCSDKVLNGNELGTDCGGTCPTCTNTVLILAGGDSGMLGGEFHPSGAWNTQVITNGTTADGVALAIHKPSGKGVGLMHNKGDDELRFTTWTASTVGGFGAWAPFAILATGVKINAAPTIGATTGDAHAAYIAPATQNEYRYAAFNGSMWTTTAESTKNNASSTAPQITVRNTGPALAFFGNSSKLLSVDRLTSAWSTSNAEIAENGESNETIPPAIVTLTNGTDLAVWVDDSANLRFSTRAVGASTTWLAAPLTIPGTATDKPVALAALTASDQAVLAYRGTDGKLYTSFFDGTKWSTVTPLPSVLTTTTPAVARGVGGAGANDAAVAELAFIETDNFVYHARFQGSIATGSWSLPVPLGGAAMQSVSIASTP